MVAAQRSTAASVKRWTAAAAVGVSSDARPAVYLQRRGLLFRFVWLLSVAC